MLRVEHQGTLKEFVRAQMVVVHFLTNRSDPHGNQCNGAHETQSNG
jgi:hypothetical protein